jgi:hypothetical protein
MKALAAAAGGLLVTAGVALGQDMRGYPDMRGQWKGTNEGVALGSGAHHREDPRRGEPRIESKEFTVVIRGQEGRRFWGELGSQEDTGPVIGVIASDRETIHFVDHAGGHATGKLLGPGRVELCYLRPGGKDVMVAACNLLAKQ